MGRTTDWKWMWDWGGWKMWMINEWLNVNENGSSQQTNSLIYCSCWPHHYCGQRHLFTITVPLMSCLFPFFFLLLLLSQGSLQHRRGCCPPNGDFYRYCVCVWACLLSLSVSLVCSHTVFRTGAGQNLLPQGFSVWCLWSLLCSSEILLWAKCETDSVHLCFSSYMFSWNLSRAHLGFSSFLLSFFFGIICSEFNPCIVHPVYSTINDPK